MGPNSRRNQQKNAASQNTAARARFSKGPPKKGGRGGRGGRDGGRGGRDGGRGGAADQTKISVVNKISKRVADKKTTGSVAISTKRRRHPLDGIDTSKLDEIKLSEESIQLVTKLLQDLNVMESDEQQSPDEEKDDGDFALGEVEEEVKSQSERPISGTGGYTEYEEDVDDFDEGYHMSSAGGEDEADEKDEATNESSADKALRESPLFLHLSFKLSFSEDHALRACRGVENWSEATDEPSEEASLNSEKLAMAMDWLCLHLTDAELTEGFKVNPKSLAKRSSTGILLVGSGRTRAIPHASISVAKPLTSDNEWRESIRREARKVGFIRLGFSSIECEKAFDQSPDLEVKSAEDDEAALRVMLAMLEKEALGGAEPASIASATKTDLDFASEEQEQEIEALQAIFDEAFQKIVTKSGLDRFMIKITPVEDLHSPANSASCKLHVLFRAGYPVLAPPLLLFTNPTLPPSLLRRINSHLAREANQMIGEPAIFPLVDYVSNSLPELQLDFVKEQRAKEMQAQQLKMRRDAGHDVDEASEGQNATENKLGRRQQAKLKAMAKAYTPPEQLKEEEEERRRQQDKRVARVKVEEKRIRLTLAERKIEERSRQRVEDEAKKASRFAMTQVLNEGKSIEEARHAAEEARKESLRQNGVEVAPDDDKVSVSAEKTEAPKEQQGVEKKEIVISEVASATVPAEQPKTTATTVAFMERLRSYYSKAALLKSKVNAVATSASSANDSGAGMLVLSEPSSKSLNRELDDEAPVHVPAPIPIPSGDLSKVMNDVIETQKKQPWLVSDEARVPTSVSAEVELTGDQIKQRDLTSKRLRSDLDQKYKAAEKVGERSSDTTKSKGGSPPEKFHRMLCQRRRLPAYKMKDTIIETIGHNQICVISGDTGCGKTTQVPQLILDDMIWKGRGAEANMIVTQPRRISAIGVSERVASERCERVGETAGYSIRLENKRSHKTRVLLCTTGILLRRLQCDPDLASISHIFVDEVHERDLNTDFLLIILRDLLARRKSLKLVLMSATLNAEAFSSYFGGCPVVSIPGRAHPVTENRLEDILQVTGYKIESHSDCALKNIARNPPRFSKAKLKQMYSPKYGATVIDSLAIVDEKVINYELLAALLETITLSNDEGAILVFMPGMGEITKAIEELYKNEFFQSSQVAVYPLHSSLSTAEQTAVFDVPPAGVRKIVVSTNIAETSITIEDVVYVVDCGRVKENRKDEVNEMPTLVETWVSRASAKQRRGRAGRVRPGISYHMYSSHTYEQELQEYQLPEMLRVGLEDLVLQILVLDLGEPCSFLAKAVNPPSALAMRNSLKLLEGLGAVEVQWNNSDDESTIRGQMDTDESCATVSNDSGLTALGFHLATLPVDPRVGKMMIYGALFGCTDPALTIAASMSARSPFMSPFDRRDQADQARQTFATEGSDPLTTLTAFEQWKEMRRTKGDRATNAFLHESFLSRLTLFQMTDLRKQFADLLVDIGFLPRGSKVSDRNRNNSNIQLSESANGNANNVALVKAVLCAGLYPNIIVAPRSLVGERPSSQAAGECAFRGTKGEVYLHPCTISHKSKKLDSRYCCYHEIVKTSKIYVRDCTTVSPFALLLFGGSLQVYHLKDVATVDEWLKFRIAAKPATLVKHLRAQMESLLLKKIVSPQEDVTGSKEGQALIQAVSTLLANEKPPALPDGAEIVRPWNGDPNDAQTERQGRGRGGGRSYGSRGRNNGRSGSRSNGIGGRENGRGGGRSYRGRGNGQGGGQAFEGQSYVDGGQFYGGRGQEHGQSRGQSRGDRDNDGGGQAYGGEGRDYESGGPERGRSSGRGRYGSRGGGRGGRHGRG